MYTSLVEMLTPAGISEALCYRFDPDFDPYLNHAETFSVSSSIIQKVSFLASIIGVFVDSSWSISLHSSCLFTFILVKHWFSPLWACVNCANFHNPPQHLPKMYQMKHLNLMFRTPKRMQISEKDIEHTRKSDETSNTEQRRSKCRLIPSGIFEWETNRSSRIVQIKCLWWDWKISPPLFM